MQDDGTLPTLLHRKKICGEERGGRLGPLAVVVRPFAAFAVHLDACLIVVDTGGQVVLIARAVGILPLLVLGERMRRRQRRSVGTVTTPAVVVRVDGDIAHVGAGRRVVVIVDAVAVGRAAQREQAEQRAAQRDAVGRHSGGDNVLRSVIAAARPGAD